MSDKNVQEVLIDGRIYQLGGYESQEYLQKVGVYINNLLDQMRQMDSWRKLSCDERHVLTEINIADDYFKAKDRIRKLEEEALAKEKELYEMKHQMAALKLRSDAQETRIAEMDRQLATAVKTIREQTEFLSERASSGKKPQEDKHKKTAEKKVEIKQLSFDDLT